MAKFILLAAFLFVDFMDGKHFTLNHIKLSYEI